MAILDNTALERGPTQRSDRSVALDAARGIAVVAMVVYHTAWDLSALSLIELDVTESEGWRWFARTIAGSFLVVAGIGLALAHRSGTDAKAFGRRLAILVAAALVITLVTRIVFPDSYIFFGILHNMAVSSLLTLPFVRAPAPLNAAIAVALWALPSWLAGPAFDAPLLAFLGLGTTFPITNDFVPILPWSGFVFAGMALARATTGLRSGSAQSGRALRLLAVIGRRSLLIYLVHQPLIFGALSGYRAIMGPNEQAEAAPFMASCRSGCLGAGQPKELCDRSCACTADALKRDGLWTQLLGSSLTAEQRERATALARQCTPGSQ